MPINDAVVEFMLNGKRVSDDFPYNGFFHYYASIYEMDSFVLRVSIENQSEWADVVGGLSDFERAVFQLRWGVGGRPGGATPWIRVMASKIDSIEAPASRHGIIHGYSYGMILTTKISSEYYSNQTISSVVRTIANNHGLRVRITNTKELLDLYPGGLPDGQFIRNRLLPQAGEAGDSSEFLFYVDKGDTLVFERLKIQTPKHTYYMGSQHDTPEAFLIKELAHSHRILEPILRGASHLELRGFDKVNKAPIVESVTAGSAQTATIGGRISAIPKQPNRALAISPASSGTGGQNIMPVIEGKAHWSEYGRIEHRIAMSIRPNFTLFPGDFVRIDAGSDPLDVNPAMTGNYLVYATRFILLRGEPKMYAYLERREES